MFKTVIDKVLGKTVDKIVNPRGQHVADMIDQIVDKHYKEIWSDYFDALATGLEKRTNLSRNEIMKICNSTFTQKFFDTYEYTIFHNSARIGWMINHGNDRQKAQEMAEIINNLTKQFVNEAMSIYKSEAIVGAFAIINLAICDAGEKFGSTKIPEYFVVEK